MAVFDKFAENYDEGHANAVKSSGFAPEYFHEYKVIEVFNYLKSKGEIGDSKINILNFGSGTGNSEPYLKKYFPHSSISSVDVSKESIEVARKVNSKLEDVAFKFFDGINIPFDKEFDIIFIANVFHHIPHSKHVEILKNLNKKLKDNGFLFIFELNPINPLTMWVAINNDYKFDKDSKLLNPFYTDKILSKSGFKERKRRYTIFFPGFLSFMLKYEKYLSNLPIGAHYYYIAKSQGNIIQKETYLE